MKLTDFLAVAETYHFALVVIGEISGDLNKHKIVDYTTGKYDNYEVVSISATAEVEAPSPITRAISVRPLVRLTIREAKANGKI